MSITQDTTEADLKQRRELVHRGGENQNLDMAFIDQPPVSAAVHGRYLILDGLEKSVENAFEIDIVNPFK